MKSLDRILRHSDSMLAAAILGVVVIIILPLPHWLLDLMFVVSIGSAVLISLIAVNATSPLHFSTFPSLLLITTLLRLALGIAATKLILGTADAGKIIATFGNLVMGGDFVVGLVAFLILVIVQFVVITNGAGRVAEVVARFTLDAMPGKQMAIDADLNSGLITEAEAKQRRKEIKEEADFYGAMDGASKFIRGDAIAAVLIIIVNIVGGLIVGLMKGQGSPMDVLRTYAMLSVGEGLVSQIPALLISTSAGLMVTRSGQEDGMGSAVLKQVVGQPAAIAGVAAALTMLAFVPGFPMIIFLALAAGVYGFYSFAAATAKSSVGKDKPEKPAQPSQPSTESVLSMVTVDPIEVEIGYGLTKLADPKQGGDLPSRVSALRRQLAGELGFVMPSVRIRDNVQLAPNDYVIRVRGEQVARAQAFADKCLAIESRPSSDPIAGMKTKDPVFGMDAVWIESGLKQQAERSGYAIVEPSAMIATHLGEVVKAHAAELLSRQDVQTLVDHVKETNAAVVEELIPSRMTIGEVQKVLQHLLRERIPIKDLAAILETLADFADRVKEPDQLGELGRAAISRTITRQYLSDEGRISCVTLEPSLAKDLSERLQQTPYGTTLALDPDVADCVVKTIAAEVSKASSYGCTPVLLTGNSLRLPLRRLLDRHGSSIPVLAYNEITANAQVEFVGTVSLQPVAPAAATA